MAIDLIPRTKLPRSLMLLIAAQGLCVIFFVGDVIADATERGPDGAMPLHLSVEALATLSLVAAIAFEMHYLRRLWLRQAYLERSVEISSAAVHDVIEAHFDVWGLSPSERDVATFLVKGLEISQIAAARDCAEGTVKAHLNAIYRKSGTHNRGDLLSVLIDSLLGRERPGADSATRLRLST